MNDPQNFQDWVRRITVNVFRMSGQPMSVNDMHTVVNIVTFFARLIHFGFTALFTTVYFMSKIHENVKKIVNDYFHIIVMFLCACLITAYMEEGSNLFIKTMTSSSIPIHLMVICAYIGKFIIAWTSYYTWHLALLGFSYISFYLFMSFMKHKPIQRASM